MMTFFLINIILLITRLIVTVITTLIKLKYGQHIKAFNITK